MKNLIIIIFSLCLSLNLSAQDKLVNVFTEPYIAEVSSIFSDLNLKKGHAKELIALPLPAGTKSYFYAITIIPKNGKIEPKASLRSQIETQQGRYPMEQIAKHIRLQESKRSTNIYLIHGDDNAHGLDTFNYFEYLEKNLSKSSHAAFVDHVAGPELYIGIENHYEMKGLKVMVEVVAVVE